jgi:hypothetical protein
VSDRDIFSREEVARVRRFLAARLDALGAPAVPTGICLTCRLRVPVLRSGVCARHWDCGVVYALGDTCPGTGRTAGLIMLGDPIDPLVIDE